MRTKKRENLGRLLRPKHIAFIGGTQVEGAIAACRRAGFEGHIWVVNPKRDQIAGVPCINAIADLPEPPDASLIALSPSRTVETVQALNEFGAGGAVCMAAGFAEVDEAGAKLQAALIAAAGETAVLGPNCMGILNQFDGAVIWGSDNHIEPAGDFGAAIISQSGALVFGITNIEQAFPLGYGISTGNQAVVDTADCIHAVLDDKRIRAIGIYLEGLEDGKALGAACWRALQKGVPIVVLKGGDTPAGESVAQSHTGAMVVERDLWDAFVKRYGLMEVSSPKALVETLKLLTVGGLPKGRRLSVVTYSGGLNGVIAARAPKLNLELSPPKPENADLLRQQMPPIVPIANPLDLNIPWISKTGMAMSDGQSIAEGIVKLAEDVADMVLFFIDVPRPDENNLDADWLPSVNGMAFVKQALDLPTLVAGIMPEGLDIELRRRLLAQGIAPLLGFNDVLEACAAAGQLGEIHAQLRGKALPSDLWVSTKTAVSTKGQLLDEAQSKALLKPYGLSLPESWSGAADEAASAAESLRFPVVLKVVSNEIAHKAKAGGVRLNLNSAAEVASAIEGMKQAVTHATNGRVPTRFLVEKMVSQPISEWIIGVKRHPALGFALMVGRGGTAVESIQQYSTILLPLIDDELTAALAGLGLLSTDLGYKSLCQAVQSVAQFVETHQDRLVALDINPVIITAQGKAMVADALIIKT